MICSLVNKELCCQPLSANACCHCFLSLSKCFRTCQENHSSIGCLLYNTIQEALLLQTDHAMRYVIQNLVETSYKTNPEQIEVMELRVTIDQLVVNSHDSLTVI